MAGVGLGDVGGWFRSADDAAVALPSSPRWGAGTGGFGRVSLDEELAAALDLLRHRRVMVLTGAGMSTGSGLPDYRGRDAVPRAPMLFQEFVRSDASRARYWARSTAGWHHFRAARPGAAHRLLVELESRLEVTGIITQNVDRLHQAAGSQQVVDLHGRIDHVVCLTCGAVTDRERLQRELLALNEGFAATVATVGSAPDGDAEVERVEGFRYPSCPCGGMLKPDVVMFGENARREAVDAAFAMLAASEALLVLGSSLTVMSGLRFVRKAARDGLPVVIVGDGATRGDDLATVRVHGRLEDVLPRWLGLLD